MSGVSVIGSSHSGSVSAERMTGIRLWTGSMKGLAAVVKIVQERIHSPSGDFQLSHRPAKAIGSPDFWEKYIGTLCLPSRRHS